MKLKCLALKSEIYFSLLPHNFIKFILPPDKGSIKSAIKSLSLDLSIVLFIIPRVSNMVLLPTPDGPIKKVFDFFSISSFFIFKTG